MCRHPQLGEQDQSGIDITSTHAYISFLQFLYHPFYFLSITHTDMHCAPLTGTRTITDKLISWQPLSPHLLIPVLGGVHCWLQRLVYEILSYLTFNTARPEQVKVYSSPVACEGLILHKKIKKNISRRGRKHSAPTHTLLKINLLAFVKSCCFIFLF